MELLLVEDDAVSSEVLSLQLSADGWKVNAAESGEAALAFLAGARALPPVVLCDQRLPGIQGAALAEAVRERYRQSGQSVVLLGMTATRAAGAQGYDSVLLKPFSTAQLRTAVHDILQGSTGTQAVSPVEEKNEGLQAIDAATFQKLRESMGLERARELYVFALADARERAGRIAAALAREDASSIGREAHMLKGSAGMIGASRLASLAATLEAAALNDSETGEAYRANFAMLGPALDDIELMLETLLPART